MAKDTKTLENLVVEPTLDTPTTETVQLKPQDFFTIIPKKEVKNNAKEEVSAKEEKPKAEPINNVHLGEISQEILDEIKPGMTVQLNFWAKELKLQYLVKEKDSAIDALTQLRNAAFAAKFGKPLPKDIVIHAVRTGSVQFQLDNAIGLDEDKLVLDAKVEVFE